MSTASVIAEVARERQKQQSDRDLPDGTDVVFAPDAEVIGEQVQRLAAAGDLKWHDLLSAEFAQVSAVAEGGDLRAGLVRIAAVAVEWVEAIDRRAGRR